MLAETLEVHGAMHRDVLEAGTLATTNIAACLFVLRLQVLVLFEAVATEAFSGRAYVAKSLPMVLQSRPSSLRQLTKTRVLAHSICFFFQAAYSW